LSERVEMVVDCSRLMSWKKVRRTTCAVSVTAAGTDVNHRRMLMWRR